MRAVAVGLLAALLLGFGLGYWAAPRPSLGTPRVITVGHAGPQPERDLTNLDTRPGAADIGRTVIQARVRAGQPPLPPLPAVPTAPAPAWTTNWTLNLPRLADGSTPCLAPTLHVATKLRVDGERVIADSIGWADCDGKPVRIGDADQVEGLTSISIAREPRFAYRTGLVYFPRQQGLASSAGLWTVRDLGRYIFGGMAYTDFHGRSQVGVMGGFTWGAR